MCGNQLYRHTSASVELNLIFICCEAPNTSSFCFCSSFSRWFSSSRSLNSYTTHIIPVLVTHVALTPPTFSYSVCMACC